MEIAHSVNKVPIRLTYERWYHIVENHDELASCYYDVLDTVENPQFVLQGNNGCLKATRNIGKRKWCVVVYKELSKHDGFVITAYFLDAKPKGELLWQR